MAGVKGESLGNEEAVWGLLQPTCTHKLVRTHSRRARVCRAWSVGSAQMVLIPSCPLTWRHTHFPHAPGRGMGEGREGWT